MKKALFSVFLLAAAAITAAQAQNAKVVINDTEGKYTISRHIYGHFSEHLGRCIYDGLWVGESSPVPNVNGVRKDIIDALKHIRIPNLRWPGGCFADEYHWMDGVGAPETRKKIINTHWGGVLEDNSFGTHEFMELCAQIGCEPYINGNLGSGTVREMSEWVEYLTFDGVSPMAALRAQNGREQPWRVKYFGVGNENWGCGGNMRPEYYADEYRRYQTYVHSYGENKIYKIACGPSDFNYDWTEKLMSIAGAHMDALTAHYYTLPGNWQEKGSSTDFTGDEYYKTLEKALRMDELIAGHSRVMDKYDPDGRVGLIVDEWGTWYDVEPGTNPGFLYQQNTMRDALVAAVTLNIFNSHSKRVVMANLAQTVNVLQAVILTEGGKMVLTPTYHVFDLYKSHQDAELLDSYVEAVPVGSGGHAVPNLHVSASESGGAVHITLANLSAGESFPIDGLIDGAKQISARILRGGTGDFNDFENPQKLRVEPFTDISLTPGGFSLAMPACAVMEITVG